MLLNNLKLVSLLIIIIFIIPGCGPDTLPSPCENITCFNNGECLHGTCICEDGYTGDSCQTAEIPQAIYISEILLTKYPYFSGKDPWDDGLPIPYCWPDLAIEIEWPWDASHLSFIQENSGGINLSWDGENFPQVSENHLHYQDVFSISIIEIDGVDSIEAVQPPEILETFIIKPDDYVFIDSLDLWPSFIELQNLNQSIELKVYLEYSFVH